MYIRLSRSCKRSCNCVQLLAQLQFLSATANAISSHLTTATATASHIKPTTASATANNRFQPGTTASTTGTHKSSPTATAAHMEILGLAQLQVQLQMMV